MYGKVILSLVLLAFVSVQLASSLKCYNCDNVSSCKSPSTVNCDQANANRTRNTLTQYYNGVNAVSNNNFSCFAGTAYSKNTTVMAVRGCIMKGAIECNYSLKNQTYTKTNCKICNTDKCNSVGAISASLATVISLLVVAKAFVM